MNRNRFRNILVTAVLSLFLPVSMAIPAELKDEEKAPPVQENITPAPAENVDRSGQGIIIPGEMLKVSQVIDIALKKNPSRAAAASTMDATRSRIGQARANYYPQISVSTAYDRINPVPGSTASPFGLRNRYDFYSGSAGLTQNIFDFGRTSSSVGIAKFNYQASRSDLENTTDQIILNVKQAYYAVLAAKHAQDVAEQIVKQMQLRLDQAQGFYQVGTRPKIDVTRAEVDLSNAKLDLIKTQNGLRIAWVTLNNAIGVPDAPEYSIEDDLEVHKYDITLEEATTRAFENRPDLVATIARQRAADEAVSLAKSNYYPTLAGNAQYDYAGSGTNDLDQGWSVGVTLNIPLFSGFLTSHQVAEAKSNLYTLKFNEESLRQQILLDIRQAYLNLQQAEESIATAKIGVKQAQENLDLANGRYEAGVGSPIEVSDAFSVYTSAQASYITALYNYKTAQASIEKAMGAR